MKIITGQRAAAGSHLKDIPPSVYQTLHSPGQPLDSRTRAYMEPRFGYDFSKVRIHTDSKAAESARSINALAYTLGYEMVFGRGRYTPGTSEGQKLLGHELAHVVQQNTMGIKNIQRAALHTGSILDEGSCEHLACNSKWACEDNTNGISCPAGTRNHDPENKKKYRPLFTCDKKCENNQTCSDSANWMAIPKSRFGMGDCGEDLVICANNKSTHGSVRDRSVGEYWEVGHGIQNALGVSPYATFTGSIYGDENDSDFKKDARCRPKPPPTEGKKEDKTK